MATRQYRRGYSFSGFEAANPADPKPGAAFDGEFSDIQKAIEDLRVYVGAGAAPVYKVVSGEGQFPFTLAATDDILFVTCALTAERVVNLPALSAADAFDIVRAPTSTGAFNLVVKDSTGSVVTTLALHADGRYARVTFDGAVFSVSLATGTFPLASDFTAKGEYNAGSTYIPGDKVSYNGSSYFARIYVPAATPPDVNPTYWQVIAAKGDAGAGAASTLAAIVALNTRILHVNSFISASDPTVGLYKTLNEALTAAAALAVDPNANLRAVLKCVGYFDEQVLRIPDDVAIAAESPQSFAWTYTGSRAANNWTARLGVNNHFYGVRWWLTLTETDETLVMDDSSQFAHFYNCTALSRPPGGDVIVQGDGRSRWLKATGAVWPKTILGWDCMIDNDASGTASTILLQNTDAAVKFADFRFFNLNYDGLFKGAGGVGIEADGLTDVHLIGGQFYGNATTGSAAIFKAHRTIAASGTAGIHLWNARIAPYSGWIEAGAGGAIFQDYEGEQRCALVGTGYIVRRSKKGYLRTLESADVYTSQRLSGGGFFGAENNGQLLLSEAAVAAPGGTSLYYALKPLAAGVFNRMFDIDIGAVVIDDPTWRAGIAVRVADANPALGAMVFFGVVGGTALAVEAWTNPTTFGSTLATFPLRDFPKWLGIWRDGANNMMFELRGEGNGLAGLIHTLAAAGSYDEIGLAVSPENAAGVGAYPSINLNGIVG